MLPVPHVSGGLAAAPGRSAADVAFLEAQQERLTSGRRANPNYKIESPKSISPGHLTR
jgi:hypothetical protein